MADDDADFCSLVGEVLKQMQWDNEFRCVIDGEELMDYLSGRANPKESQASPRPDLILLDLNMPRKNGFEVLKEIRSIPGLRKLPVIMFTISKDRRDILRSYELGANTFITKPFSFDTMRKVFQSIKEYWFECAELP